MEIADAMTSVRPRSAGPTGQRLHTLLSVLEEAGLEPTAVELADTLWLATHLTPPPAPRAEAPAAPGAPPPADRDHGSPLAHAPAPPPAQEASPVPSATQHAGLYPRTGGGGMTGRPFRAPAVPMLPEALALGRALRPLHRKIPSRTRTLLDVEATVEQVAAHRLARQPFWAPVHRRAPERWFDLALIIDYGASMRVWQPLLDEIQHMLLYNGAFRAVRLWSLETDAETPCLYAGGSPQGGRRCRPDELLTPDDRRLFLVLSDCISRAWHTGEVMRLLQRWSAGAPLAVLHLLPPRMWPGTALGRGEEVRLSAMTPGVLNARLVRERMAGWPSALAAAADREETLTLTLPVLALEPEAVLGWANLLDGKPQSWVLGAVFTDATRYAAPGPAVATQRPSAEALDSRLQRFFAQASPLAQRLAGYLAAAPLTLPVMRLVQQVMLPQAGHLHLAEVFVSGLLTRTILDAAEAEPLLYDFHDGVRERLLDLIATWEAVDVLHQVSTFVAQHTGGSLDFQALLADPTAMGPVSLDAHTRYFALIGAKVLRRLGGAYMRLAAQLEGAPLDHPPAPLEPMGPVPFRDRFLTSETEGPAMLWLPGGTFMMGDDASESSGEKPAHQVTLSAFGIGTYPVTFAEYEAFCAATGREIPGDEGWGREERPVIHVSWDEARAYCQWLSVQTGQAYQLLTEAQWEYACRAGRVTAYSFGEDAGALEAHAWYWENAERQTHPVGQKSANPWGMYDMHGNVWEWVQDWYGTYRAEPQHDPSGPESGSHRVLRGGSWGDDAGRCRSAYRPYGHPAYRDADLGFRLARGGPQPSDTVTLPSDQVQPEALLPTVPVPGLRDTLQNDVPGPAMVWLPGGTFRMGDDQSTYEDEKPVHTVAIRTFSLGQHPVTCEEYDRFCDATGRDKPDDAGWGRGRRPVINVSWGEACAYCAWLSEQTGAHYRLPSEAEWEYACRAGGATQYGFGDDTRQLVQYAWYSRNARTSTWPVGRKLPNAWSLYDMHGNVWEWVQDWYAAEYYASSPRENPSGPESGSCRVLRGGGWGGDAELCRSAFRDRGHPADRNANLGFRLARDGPWPLHPGTLGAASGPRPLTPESVCLPKPVSTPSQGFRDRLRDGAEAPDMVYIPGGTFRMGDSQGRGAADERPVHRVRLEAFAIGRYPVTVGEYRRFVDATGSHHPEWLGTGSPYHLVTGTDDHYQRAGVRAENVTHPVVGIAWEDATAYCEWLSAQTGERYALPTEAEWEYACRAGSETAYAFGNDEALLGEYAWYAENSEGTMHAIGQKQPNPWGVYDMHGNVWEWVRDWYGAYSQRSRSNPGGPKLGSNRVLRGGSWGYVAEYCRSAYRDSGHPADRDADLGFRLARRV